MVVTEFGGTPRTSTGVVICLVALQEKAIKRTQEEMVASLKRYQKVYFGIRPSIVTCQDFEDLPVVYFAYFLSDPALYGVPDPFVSVMNLNKNSIDQILEFMKHVLHRLDNDLRINGKLCSKCTNAVFFQELVELLSMHETHPPRNQILYLEASSEEPTKESSLREEVVAGRLQSLVLAIDVFLEYSHRQAASMSCKKMPKFNRIVEEIWTLIDLDGDGTLGKEESLELTRLLLSRPMLGKMLITMVAAEHHNSSWVVSDQAKEMLPSLINILVCDMAQKLKSISTNLWRHMDPDNDGQVDGVEFCGMFPIAFSNVIALPLSAELAKVGSERVTQSETPVNQQIPMWVDLPVELPLELPKKQPRNCLGVGVENEHCRRNCTGCVDVFERERLEDGKGSKTQEKVDQKTPGQIFVHAEPPPSVFWHEEVHGERMAAPEAASRRQRACPAVSEIPKAKKHSSGNLGCGATATGCGTSGGSGPGCSIM